VSEAIEALIFALGDCDEEVTQSVLLVNAHPHPGLQPWRSRLHVTQWSKTVCQRLEETGLVVTEAESLPKTCDEVWLLPDRQRGCQLGELADAWERVAPGGWLRVSLRNDWGAKSLEEQWRATYPGVVEVVSKHHCRVFSSRKDGALPQQGRLKQWRTQAAMRRLPETDFWSRPGLFSWDRGDTGTLLLAKELPVALTGAGADLGVGWGLLSVELLKRCPDIDSLDGFDVDARALEPARRNLGNVLVPVRPRLFWRDVTRGVGVGKYDFVVMNPPFHEGRDADPGLGLKFITSAAQALKKDGVLWMVANVHLPYETLLNELFDEVRLVSQRFGFKVLTATGVQSKVHQQVYGRRSSRRR